MTVTHRRIEDLTPDPANPRHHSKKQIRQIAASIKAFGFNVSVLVDRDSNVLGGHGRILACGELGWTEVPTVCLNHLTATQARAFRIADNRLAEIPTWDDQLLAQQLKDLSLLGLDFSLELTGFAMGEIDLRIAALEDPADRLPDVPTRSPISRIGDVWRLGRHRVACANTLDPTVLTELMGEQRAAMVFTDPPSNVPIDGHVGELGAIHHRPFPMACGEMDDAEFTAFLGQACANLAAFSVDGSLHFICIDWRHIKELLAAGRAVYAELINLCVWTKDNAGWARSIAASTSWCLSSNMAGTGIATMSNSANSGATAAMSGSIPVPIPLLAPAMRVIF